MPSTSEQHLVNFRIFSFLVGLALWRISNHFVYYLQIIMTKSKRLLNKMLYDSFGCFIHGKTIPTAQFLCSKNGND